MSFNNGKHIIRTKKNRDNPYALIDKTFTEDTRLSWKAKGLLAYLLTRPDDWTIMVKDLIKRSKDGRDSVYAGLRELEKYGYLERRVRRDEKGRIIEWESIVYERPIVDPENDPEPDPTPDKPLTENPEVDHNQPLTENPYLENPDTEKPNTGNPTLLNNDSTNYRRELTTEEKINNKEARKERKGDDKEDVVDVVLKKHGIKTTKKVIKRWRSMSDDSTIVRVIEETMRREGVKNVVGYITSVLQDGYVPPTPSHSTDISTEGLPYAVRLQLQKQAAGEYEERQERKIADDPELLQLVMGLEERVRNVNRRGVAS